MDRYEWRLEAARSSLGRLLPRLEKTYEKELSDVPVQWNQFKNRLNREWERLFVYLHQLYGWQYDFFYTLELIIDLLIQYWLERPADLSALDEPESALAPLRGRIVLDEVQRRPDLFPVLRVLLDRKPLPSRFLILGSASPELLRQSSETLAGRIEIVEMGGFDLEEVGEGGLRRLWVAGRFPRSWLARSYAESLPWRY